MKNVLILSALLLTFSACNKEKRFSRKFIKGEVWSVTAIRVDGTKMPFKGEWLISQDVDIYDSVPQCIWKLGSMDAVFEWQFQNKGKSLQLNYMQLCAECEASEMDTLDYIAFNLTGNYSVEQHRRNKMRFSSTETIGYVGENIEIALERK